MTAEQAVYVETEREKQQRLARASAKRGALCVDEVREEPANKRVRVPRRDVLSQDIVEKLVIDAASVIDKLTTPKHTHSECSATACASEQTRSKTRTDQRLQNIEFVKNISLRRYMDRCRRGEDRLNAIRLHDVFVSANEFVRTQRHEARQREAVQANPSSSKTKRHVFSGELKSRLVGLVLCLWKACCLSPYLSNASRGSDSFRPFVAGVLYSLKRGLQLQSLNGLEVIPSLPEITDNLPTLRSADASNAARQLQSSSHRGVCTLHKAVASLEEYDEEDPNVLECRQAFVNCEVVAQQLERYARRPVA
tara:strand:+ start:131 stop:1057 length:927 start_codon:yes stop_codon:yes gene_type:complete